MHKIVISGYYGFNNIGDESILTAVLDNLRDKIDNLDITVLSQNPQSTREKYGVKAVKRMSLPGIVRSIARSDLLISGGGSLLQDVTSKKSILYYLAVMWIAILFGKKVFIYSQGIGPVNSGFNRRVMIKTLKRVDTIVVRDEGSKEFLLDNGIKTKRIIVTADPVIRIKPPALRTGQRILEDSGLDPDDTSMKIGIAVKGRLSDEDFISELCIAIRELKSRWNAKIVLIPFHYTEDMQMAKELSYRVGEDVTLIRQKCLSEEMLSVIGNMDLLVGVRLHSLIHASIMEVPMIGISYDPKVNSFMKSMDLRAMCSVYDFKGEYLIEEVEKVMVNRDIIINKVRTHKAELIEKLDRNEEMIRRLLGEDGNV